MSAQYTQRAVINAGFTSSPAHSFASSVTGGATVLAFFWFSGAGPAITSVTDSKGNTYSKIKSGSSGNGTPFELWGAFGVTGGSSFTVTGHASSSGFTDVALFEYSATLAASVRASNFTQQSGGTKVTPRTTLTGTTTGDLVVGMAFTSNFSLLGASGAIGANSPTSTTDDSASTGGGTTDPWLIIEGNSDGSSPCTVTFGSTTDDFYGAIAAAFVPASVTAAADALFLGNPTLI